MTWKGVVPFAVFSIALSTSVLPAQTIDLPTSKQLVGEIPGNPQRLNSLPKAQQKVVMQMLEGVLSQSNR